MNNYDVLCVQSFLEKHVDLEDFCLWLSQNVHCHFEFRRVWRGSLGTSIISLLQLAQMLDVVGDVVWQLAEYWKFKNYPSCVFVRTCLPEQIRVFEVRLRERGESAKADAVKQAVDQLIADCSKPPPGQPPIEILHLSDLHFGTLEDAHKWHAQIAGDLKYELRCERLDGLIISGDLTQRSTATECAAAVEFLTLLSREFGLDAEHIVIVPGNHDVNWDLSEQAYCVGDRRVFNAADETERRRWFEDSTGLWVRHEQLYRKRFDLFSKALYRPIKGVPYPCDYPDQFSMQNWPELGLLVVGFNSAWEIDDHYGARASIHPLAVTGVLNALRDRKNADWDRCLKLAVWHHPLASPENSRITDQGFLQLLAQAGFRLALHGHIHMADTQQYHYDQRVGGRRLDIVAAGTFGAPIRDWVPGYPLQYNLLRLQGDQLCVETRCRRQVNGAWRPDALWLQGAGLSPLPHYSVSL